MSNVQIGTRAKRARQNRHSAAPGRGTLALHGVGVLLSFHLLCANSNRSVRQPATFVLYQSCAHIIVWLFITQSFLSQASCTLVSQDAAMSIPHRFRLQSEPEDMFADAWLPEVFGSAWLFHCLHRMPVCSSLCHHLPLLLLLLSHMRLFTTLSPFLMNQKTLRKRPRMFWCLSFSLSSSACLSFVAHRTYVRICFDSVV